MVKFIQIKLNGYRAAEQLMFQVAEETEADVLILSEPSSKYGSEDKWCFSTNRKAAIAVTQRLSITQLRQGAGAGFAWMMFGDLAVVSCYWRPGTTLQEFALFLGELEDAIRDKGDVKVVLAGDFNAWNTEWGSRVNNPRGCLLSDLSTSLGLTLANTGSVPTFVRGTATSVIDVTFYRGVAIAGWRVLDTETLSDHNYVSFEIPADHHAPPSAEPPEAPLGWS